MGGIRLYFNSRNFSLKPSTDPTASILLKEIHNAIPQINGKGLICWK